ncbi:MAG: hypothetical protein ACREM1_16735 [Longimicrobiales bacterium]
MSEERGGRSPLRSFGTLCSESSELLEVPLRSQLSKLIQGALLPQLSELFEGGLLS